MGARRVGVFFSLLNEPLLYLFSLTRKIEQESVESLPTSPLSSQPWKSSMEALSSLGYVSLIAKPNYCHTLILLALKSLFTSIRNYLYFMLHFSSYLNLSTLMSRFLEGRGIGERGCTRVEK